MNKFAIVLAIAACLVSTISAQAQDEIPSTESEIAASPELEDVPASVESEIPSSLESEIASSSEPEIPASPEPEIPASADAPVLTAGKPMVIKGSSENGEITINGSTLFNDRKLREKNSVNIKLREDNGLYVNHSLVLQQNPDAPIITQNPHLKAKNVASFEIQIDDKGDVTYVVKASK